LREKNGDPPALPEDAQPLLEPQTAPADSEVEDPVLEANAEPDYKSLYFACIKELEEAKIENQNLKEEIDNHADVIEYSKLLQTLFTENEIAILSDKKKKVKWTSVEIAKAFTLRYLSKRAYIYYREKLKYPLPGL
jgi:hypothetical protein